MFQSRPGATRLHRRPCHLHLVDMDQREGRAMNESVEKNAYRISEFWQAFGVGRTKVFDEIKDGRLKIRKAGRMTLIRAEDAKAWIDALPEK